MEDEEGEVVAAARNMAQRLQIIMRNMHWNTIVHTLEWIRTRGIQRPEDYIRNLDTGRLILCYVCSMELKECSSCVLRRS